MGQGIERKRNRAREDNHNRTKGNRTLYWSAWIKQSGQQKVREQVVSGFIQLIMRQPEKNRSHYFDNSCAILTRTVSFNGNQYCPEVPVNNLNGPNTEPSSMMTLIRQHEHIQSISSLWNTWQCRFVENTHSLRSIVLFKGMFLYSFKITTWHEYFIMFQAGACI